MDLFVHEMPCVVALLDEVQFRFHTDCEDVSELYWLSRTAVEDCDHLNVDNQPMAKWPKTMISKQYLQSPSINHNLLHGVYKVIQHLISTGFLDYW